MLLDEVQEAMRLRYYLIQTEQRGLNSRKDRDIPSQVEESFTALLFKRYPGSVRVPHPRSPIP